MTSESIQCSVSVLLLLLGKKKTTKKVCSRKKKTFEKDSPSQGSGFRRVRFETESCEKHRVPRFRGTLDCRNVVRGHGAHHILHDSTTRGLHSLLRGCERKLAPRVSNACRSEYVEIDLRVRRTVSGSVGCYMSPSWLTCPSGWLWLTKDA